ncbi:MAG TPA: sigma-70 family RNA polymerase sigma factor [Ktedonobacteraceae bacterium]
MYEETDADLVCMARADNTEAFRLLIERYRPMAFAIVLQQVLQQETAQDLVQEATLQAYLSLNQLQDATCFKNWFYGIVLNTCRYWRRKQRTSFILLDESAEDLLKADDADPSDLVEENELRAAM